MSVHLGGPLDTTRLIEAVRLLVARHESLRTTVSPSGAHLCIAARMAIDVPVTAVDASAKDAVIQRAIAAEMARPFDLTAGPLFRAQILEFGWVWHLKCRTYSVRVQPDA